LIPDDSMDSVAGELTDGMFRRDGLIDPESTQQKRKTSGDGHQCSTECGCKRNKEGKQCHEDPGGKQK